MLAFIFVITSITSINSIYSIYSGLFIVALLTIMFNVIGPFLISLNTNIGLRRKLSLHFLLILLIAILGDFLIPSWNWDSTIRLSGGVNPNMLALIALFIFIWFIDLKIDKLFSRLSNLGLLLSLIVLLWTVSRGRIGSMVILIVYLSLCIFIVMMIPKFQFKFKKKKAMINCVLGIIILMIISVGLFVALQNEGIVNRLSTPIDGRENAWLILIEGFNQNKLFGSFGWWNANDVVKQYATDNINIASSAHNLYLRLLSEVGIIGLVFIMALPLYLVIKSMKTFFLKVNIDNTRRLKLILYSGALIAFFASQFFEDQYLNGIGDFQTGLFIWLITYCYYLLISSSNIQLDK